MLSRVAFRRVPGFGWFFSDAGLFVLSTSVACLIRMWAWYLQPLVSRDGIYYLTVNAQLAADGRAAPLAPYLTRLIQLGRRYAINPETLVVLVNIAAGSLLAGVMYGIARRCNLPQWAAAIAALLCAVNPLAVKVSHMVQRESLFMLGVGVALWALLSAWEHRGRARRIDMGLVGAALAFAAMARMEAAEWLFLFNVFVIGGHWLRRESTGDTWRDCVWLNVAFVLFLMLLVLLLRLSWKELAELFVGKFMNYTGL